MTVPVADIAAIPVQSIPHTANGVDVVDFLSNGTAKNGVIKNSPGQLYAVTAFSVDETPVYIRLYNKATAPLTTDTPVYRLMIPGSNSGIGSGFMKEWPLGLDVFTAGIGYRITTGIADDDDAVVSANEVIVNFEYK